jgi:hypothetical protein
VDCIVGYLRALEVGVSAILGPNISAILGHNISASVIVVAVPACESAVLGLFCAILGLF